MSLFFGSEEFDLSQGVKILAEYSRANKIDSEMDLSSV